MGNQYYKKYSKNENEKPSYIKLFFGAFFMMLILFVVIAVHLFSSVDTAIGENDEGDIKESGLGVKHLIDSRLKFIQMEDSDKHPSNSVPNVIQTKEQSAYSTNSNEGEVSTQNYGNANYSNSYGNNNTFSNSQTAFPGSGGDTIKHPVSTINNQQNARTSSTVYKVYIGSYSTLEQARVAQSIIQDANLGVTSFVKSSGNAYTIQVGSYSDAAKAQGLASELKRNHFPARMVQE